MFIEVNMIDEDYCMFNKNHVVMVSDKVGYFRIDLVGGLFIEISEEAWDAVKKELDIPDA